MFVLGIDPGLARTGYGLVGSEGGTERVGAAGVVRTNREQSVSSRLRELHTDIRDLIRDYQPHAMAIETLFVNQNTQTAASVGQASGVVMLAAAEENLEVFEYTPSQVKAAVTGYGSAPKEQVARMVARLLGLEDQPFDAADALAVALCHVQTAGLRTALERST
ncbi:MAG: crossover junction endodeoxyribonuclease RuvC [Acidimicrobiia bacterium]